MSSETIDYAAVLTDLEAKRAAIDSTIAGIRQMLNLGAEQGVTPSTSSMKKDQPTEVRSDSFFGMTMPDAITKFLSMAKRTQSVSEITQALQDGGFPTTAKNLMPSVGSTLSRMKAAGGVASVQGKWGLSSWYPGMRKESPAKGKKERKRNRKGPKTPTADGANKAPGKSTPSKLTLEQIEQIKNLHAEGKKPGEIGKELSISTLTVWRTLKPNSPKSATA